MLQDMDHMEASWVCYGKVSTLNQLKQIKICILSIIAFRIVQLNVSHDLIVSVCFGWNSGEVLRQTSPDVLSVEEFPFYIYQI